MDKSNTEAEDRVLMNFGWGRKGKLLNKYTPHQGKREIARRLAREQRS